MTSDPNNYILNTKEVIKEGKNAGKTRLRPIAYYSRVSDLVEGIIDRKMRNSTTRTMKGFIQEHQALVDEIRKLFKVGITGIGTMPCSECGAKAKKRAT
jgi:hypothetical protein